MGDTGYTISLPTLRIAPGESVSPSLIVQYKSRCFPDPSMIIILGNPKVNAVNPIQIHIFI